MAGFLKLLYILWIMGGTSDGRTGLTDADRGRKGGREGGSEGVVC